MNSILIPLCALALALPSLGSTQDRVAKSAADAVPITVGTIAPDSTLRTLEGKKERLSAVLGGKPTVLIFYRGGWCPFCNAQLADLQRVEGDLRHIGFQLVAISPDRPEELVKTMDKHSLTYRLYSDSKATALKNFGIAFRVDDQTFSTLRGYHVDLERSSGENHHILPVPSVFLIDQSGKIVYVHSNPDYKVRMMGNELLDVARHVQQSPHS
jgi:peroxiredoxin